MKFKKLQDDPLRPMHGFQSKAMDFRIGDNSDLGLGPLIIIDFVLLQSPFASARDPETVIVRRKHELQTVVLNYLICVPEVLSNGPRLPEIIWNFSRFEGRACITLEQNPHFYSSHPTDEGTHLPRFHFSPVEDSGQPWRHHRTIYVLVDRPGRVFLETKLITRSFGNVWMMNNFLILKGLRYNSRGACSLIPSRPPWITGGGTTFCSPKELVALCTASSIPGVWGPCIGPSLLAAHYDNTDRHSHTGETIRGLDSSVSPSVSFKSHTYLRCRTTQTTQIHWVYWNGTFQCV